MGLEIWSSPSRDFAYSRGEPRGKSQGTVTVPLLLDSSTSEMVPCISRHSTCQGVKICPMSYFSNKSSCHSAASRSQLQAQLLDDHKYYREISSPACDVFERTLALITAVRCVGCTARTALDLELAQEDEVGDSQTDDRERKELRRGYPEIPNRCTGRIIFGYTFDETPFIKENRYHFFDNSIGNGRYHTEYLKAVLDEDDEGTSRIECEAETNGYGPRALCRTVVNKRSQRATCGSIQSNLEENHLKHMKFEELSCTCKFREYEPVEEYRNRCPYVLVVSKGTHLHPIPLPEKTPATVRTDIEILLKKMDYELADMTPRLFLRHPLVKSYLSTRFPLLQNPMLIYIQNMKKQCFPVGTGWKGLIHLKSQQDTLLEPAEQYIPCILEVPTAASELEDDDLPEDSTSSKKEPSRIVTCMTTDASWRLVRAQYLQSDIGFKRVVGFYEFELASVDMYTNTSITFCRVYMTQQTAFAHKKVLKHINNILVQDTGRGFTWRHIHGSSIDDYDGHIVNWVVDQHGGQAKVGIGLFLHDMTQTLPPKFDFHEPSRLLQTLSPYDHLRRFLTLCTTHFHRNICKCSVPEQVQNVMRSLSCIRHDNWDGAIHEILHLGGTPAQSVYLTFQNNTQFAFPVLCWEKSYIPLEIWQARQRESNVVEIVHANIN
ncbi:hypothetical protein GYMLUDRAFT_1028506 [Collybiopsis luxurians FD-317 M1]|uniref:Uncharacterized protein n=1 Tax=Collybiopsis luxurians FD-317 M1 TaxID=944289 RepID=A0A0D0C4I4_9AGAR|nr:hypothetical protein GYMLUDRAFT_1028506 [Collybiopsis luxurians FD-317 M1]